MSKRRLLITILIFILTIVLVVGASYLASLLLKNTNTKKAVGDTTNQICFVTDLDLGLR